MNVHQLRSQPQVLRRELPDELLVVALIVDYVDEGHINTLALEFLNLLLAPVFGES